MADGDLADLLRLALTLKEAGPRDGRITTT